MKLDYGIWLGKAWFVNLSK